MTSEVNTTVFSDSKAASPEDSYCLFKTQVLMLKDLFLHLQSHDVESDQVLTRLFLLPHPAQVGPWTMGSVCIRSRSSSLPQRGQVDVPEQRHQVGKEHSELPREHRPQ